MNLNQLNSPSTPAASQEPSIQVNNAPVLPSNDEVHTETSFSVAITHPTKPLRFAPYFEDAASIMQWVRETLILDGVVLGGVTLDYIEQYIHVQKNYVSYNMRTGVTFATRSEYRPDIIRLIQVDLCPATTHTVHFKMVVDCSVDISAASAREAEELALSQFDEELFVDVGADGYEIEASIESINVTRSNAS